MRFSGGALAILGASKDGTDRHNRSTHRRSLMMSSSSNSATPITTSRTTNRQQQHTGVVTTSAITNLQRLREIVECDPTSSSSSSVSVVDFDNNDLTEERRLRGRSTSNTNSDHDGTTKMTANTKDDDFGILNSNNINSFTFTSACGVGRKCQKVSASTSASTSGGICVDVEGWNKHRNLQQKGSGSSENDVEDAFVLVGSSTGTTTADNYVTTGILNEMQYLCDYGDLVGYDCECNFNKQDYTGSGACIIAKPGNDEICTTSTSICDASIENCYSSTYGVTLVPSSSSSSLGDASTTTGSWDAEICLQFSKPYEQTVCYTTRNTITSSDDNDAEEATTGRSNPYGCSISIDGETCTSCEIAESSSSNDDEKTCYLFDCRNTQTGMNGISKVGNTCDYPVYPISLYLDTYGCPTCNLCDISDVMTSPDSTITVAGSETAYVCSTVAEIAGLGFFTTDTCKYFANLATDSCGCISSSASSITDYTIAAIDAAEADADTDDTDVDRTSAPVVAAAVDPTSAPIAATINPTTAPVVAAVVDPTSAPAVAATVDPTSAPVVAATVGPTTAPVAAAVVDPTSAPADAATVDPTSAPVAATVDPTSAPVAATVDPTSAPVSDPPTPSPIVPGVTTEAPTADSPQMTDAPIFVVAAAPTDDGETDYPVGNITDAFEGLDETDAPSYPMTEPPVITNQDEIEDGASIDLSTDGPSVQDTSTYDATAESDDISSRNDATDDDIDRTSTDDNDETDVEEQVVDIDVNNMNDYCSPCGPGKKVLTSKYDNNEVSIPTQGTFTCKELNEIAKQRSFNPICALVQSAANVPCGCNDYEEESASTNATKSTDTDTDASSSSSTTSVDSTASAAASGTTTMNYYCTFVIIGVVTSTIMIASSSSL